MRIGRGREDAQMRQDSRRLALDALHQVLEAGASERFTIHALAECNERWGVRGIAVMMETWVSMLVTGMRLAGLTYPRDQVPFAIEDPDTGAIVDPDTEPELAWAARLLVASQAIDVEMVRALLAQFAALPEEAKPQHIMALLTAVAIQIKALGILDEGEPSQ